VEEGKEERREMEEEEEGQSHACVQKELLQVSSFILLNTT
jgi:hypothetical protein